MTVPGRHAPLTPGMGFGDAPVGSVIAFAGQVAPANSLAQSAHRADLEAVGWMLCDGRALPVNSYPQLFVALGYSYGGSGDIFMLPDYRVAHRSAGPEGEGVTRAKDALPGNYIVKYASGFTAFTG